MKKLMEILKTYKHAIIWTLCYIALLWCLLYFVFGFDIFYAKHWYWLAIGHIKRFPGIVFGILILSAVPLYIATVTTIVRTKEPLFNFFEKKKKEKKEEKAEDKKEDKEEEKPLPENLPSELIGAFLRVRENGSSAALRSAFNIQNGATVAGSSEEITTSDESLLPLPDDFNFNSAPEEQSVPMFKEISFGTSDEQENLPVPNFKELGKNPVADYLENNGHKVSIIDEIIVTDKIAMAIHDDPDFWIADDDNWFAVGKQKQSPILSVLNVAKSHNVKPVIYLSEKNIMDLDKKISDWEQMGITIIEDLSEI